MSIDPSIQVDGWEAVSKSFEELRAGCEESGRYFVSQFDEMESLLTGVVREREQWLDERGRGEEQLRDLTTRLEHLEEEYKNVLTERDSLRQEHALLEGELDHLRRRAAQLAEHLEDERRTSAEQAEHWRDEVRRLRGVLEELTARMSMTPPVAPPAARSETETRAGRSPEPAHRERDSALESVQAQFELLQRDANRRRKDIVEAC